MEAMLDVRGLLHAILTCVTAGPGLGFNRAVLFLTNGVDMIEGSRTHLVAAMAVGPATSEEAHATWATLESKSLDELLNRPLASGTRTGFQTLVEGLTVPLEEVGADAGRNPLLEAFHSRRAVKVADGADIPSRLREAFAGTELVCVPLVAKERAIGVIVADNAFNREPIGEQRIQLLQLLALLAGMALDNARIYQQLERQAQQLQKTIAELNAAQEQLLHSERLATVGAVVARVSHEIRNPLTTIGGFARTLSTRPDDVGRVRRNADIIVEEVEKLEALLREMLDFTSPKPPALDPTDLNAVITAFVALHRSELDERHIALESHFSPDLPLVPADRHQLQRVLMNLWQNAVHAMEEGAATGTKTLRIKTSYDGRRVHIVLSDTGSGIPRHVLPHIFTPFFTTKTRGTGLGMAVVKKIIDDHRGSIDVQSEPQRGTSCDITLPLARERS